MTKIKDVPFGILIILRSQFVMYGVVYLAKFPLWYETLGIVFGTLFASDMVHFGIRLIKGYNYVEPNKH